MSRTENKSRSAARLAIVQALYQMEAGGTRVDSLVAEFNAHRLGGELDGETLHDADVDFFSEMVKGVVSAQSRLDPYIEKNLAENWTLKRINSTARAIIRAALFELTDRPEIPFRVVLDEYLDIANAFFDSEECRFINGILDTAAHDLRANETAEVS